MRHKLLLLLLLAVVSVFFYLLHSLLAPLYVRFMLWLYSFFIQGTGRAACAVYDSSFRMIPFLSLLLVTPRLSWNRRLAFVAIGVAVFFCLDLVSMLIWDGPPPPQFTSATSEYHILYSLVWDLMGHWVLPLLLWLSAAYRVLPRLFTSPQQGPE